jgi:release factor glutamine methyltransferase
MNNPRQMKKGQTKKKSSNKELLKAADEAILSAVLNLPREYLISHPEAALEKNLSAKHRRKISRMRQQILAGQPLAYVLGEKWFYDHRFFVNKNVLIPRPETELLVDCALAAIQKNRPANIYDIGTGSGAIAVSLAYAVKQKNTDKRKGSAGQKFTAVDISAKALEVAKFNAKSILQKEWRQIKFVRSDLLQKVSRIPTNSLICANLPYLSKKELKEPSISKEPVLALRGAYKKDASASAAITSLLRQLASKRKGRLEIILEINYNQAKKITAMSKRLFPMCAVKVVKDYSGYDRIIIITVY